MSSNEFMELMMTLTILAVIAYVVLMVTGIIKGKETTNMLKADDDKPEQLLRGRVLEKNTESKKEGVGIEIAYTVDWIVFEREDGVRYRLRNLKPDEIILAVGDVGTLAVRGETIYRFEK